MLLQDGKTRQKLLILFFNFNLKDNKYETFKTTHFYLLGLGMARDFLKHLTNVHGADQECIAIVEDYYYGH